MNDFRSELEEYNINDLRKLGRELNVQSPTVADKQELVQKIQEVIFSKTKISEYGAKPDFTDVVKVNSEDVSLIERAAIVTQTNQAIIPFGNMCEGHFMPFCDSEGLTLDGVIRENCFVDEVENIFVAQSVICKYDIRPGDYVKGRCIRLKESNFFALFHAEEINGEATRDKIVKGGGKKQQKLKEGHVVLNDMILRDTFSLLKTSYPYQPIELGKDKYLRAIETLTPI